MTLLASVDRRIHATRAGERSCPSKQPGSSSSSQLVLGNTSALAAARVISGRSPKHTSQQQLRRPTAAAKQ